MAFYNTSTGLDFPDPEHEMWVKTFKQMIGEEAIDNSAPDFPPKSPESAMLLINEWFAISKQILIDNETQAGTGPVPTTRAVSDAGLHGFRQLVSAR